MDDYFEDPDGAAPIYAIEKLPEVMKSMTATLKRCSKDDASSDYMTESRLLAVNFDRFSKYYCQVVKIAQQPKTNDALYCTEDGKCILWSLKMAA